jgi:hypothetical protein
LTARSHQPEPLQGASLLQPEQPQYALVVLLGLTALRNLEPQKFSEPFFRVWPLEFTGRRNQESRRFLSEALGNRIFLTINLKIEPDLRPHR